MARFKYDYAKLKAEFMQSDIDNIKSFLNSKWIGNKINETKTTWWTEEKQQYKQRLAQRAIEKTLEKQATQLSAKIPIERLIRMKSDFFDLIDQAIDWMQQKDNVDIEKVIKWLNAIKTELWEPTTVAKNENENKDKIEAISIVIWQHKIDKE